jgi:tRNA(Ile2)-agmatinylcytidine synthase
MGQIDGRPVWSFESGRSPGRPARTAFLEEAWQVVRRAARGGGPGTDPALVAVDRRLPAAGYWSAVRDVVEASDVQRELARSGAWVRWEGSDRGLVGAAAAVAWAGGHPTWEVIAYRHPDRWGTTREVDAASVRSAQQDFPGLFLCYDNRTRRLLVAPHTPCPILFGLRGVDPDSPRRALPRIRSEPVERWLLFRTNQGTGDHLVVRGATDWPELTSGRFRGRVMGPPTVLPGGHVRFDVADRSNDRATCVAFEPTKTLPAVARELRSGDRVHVWGSRGRGGSIRLEGIEVVRWAPFLERRGSPRCPQCRRQTRSVGRLRGFQCPGCHRRLPPEAARPLPRAPALPSGVYHPTPSARRHLAPRGPEN